MLIVGSWRNGSAPAWHAGGCGFKMGGWTAMRHENPAESTFVIIGAVVAALSTLHAAIVLC